ncbi:LysR substrate-binding domain-containing protein [Candidimonas nitroreducens]|uniref:HTH lysR-type domain-containing protein n=1 Tax=Candidimonas nitroreducens TaxID=683354 RepID=A0A225M6J8_9BURK|nr:LysR substrate-binding domain-containing protein [Candidimonas nitroreducens]OWT56898.1 hypothetical protein CEY11_18665 [Candidimonas nitroreducens]
MRRRPLPLNSLRAFEVLGRHGKLAGAADELCISLGAVSRHIGIVETYVGVRLFDRHRNGFSLTDKGSEYLRLVSQAFDQLDSATTRLLDDRDQPRLSVCVFTTFASEWLVPRLSSFLMEHPEIDFRLSSSVTSKGIDREDVDVGIRRGPVGSGMDADALYCAEYYPVCSPDMLRRAPGLNSPRDMLRLPLLNTEQQAGNWSSWLAYAGVGGLDIEKTLWFENGSLAFRAAREGVGVALGQRHYLVEDLIAGRLVAPFPQAIRRRTPFYMVYAKRRANEPHILAFRKWVLEQITDTEMRSTLIRNHPTDYLEID